jgi:hypothetical protein
MRLSAFLEYIRFSLEVNRMARDGSGTYQKTLTAVTGAVISSTTFNAQIDDIATELTNSIPRDGQAGPTADVPMSTYKFTGVGNAAARTQFASAGQVQDGSCVWGGDAGGTANAITFTLSPPLSALAAGQRFGFIATDDNTGATTVAVSGQAAKDLFNLGSACVGGEIVTGQVYEVVYDGTQFHLNGSGDLVGLLTTQGDIAVRGASGPERLAVGAANTVLLSDGTDPSYGAVSGPYIAMGSDAAGDIIQRGASDYERLAIGTAGQVLHVNSGADALEYRVQPGIIPYGLKTLTSGTEHDWTSLDPAVSKYEIWLNAAQLSGSEEFLLQIGDSGGFETSLYIGDVLFIGTGSVAFTSGFQLFRAMVNTSVYTGKFELQHIDSNRWQINGHMMRDNNDYCQCVGYKALSDTLTQIRLTTTGADTFVAGSAILNGIG